MNVRRYRPGDGEAVRRLHERVLRDAGTDPADIPHPEDIEDVRASYIEAGGEFLVVEDDGEIVAIGGLRVDGTEGELFRMRVAIDRQGEGIGSRLLDALETAARERGVETLHAETAQRQEKAVEFYPANGYEQVGTSPRGEYTLIAYEKDLTATA
ncbi:MULTISPECIES: GNAT family N-acetyltransferase [Salinibaculum]|uniref:GNAT family N-acetyltransferase n=1 Tax=Salinibaculum TaxID=2732368 RepID=UPI0030CC976A